MALRQRYVLHFIKIIYQNDNIVLEDKKSLLPAYASITDKLLGSCYELSNNLKKASNYRKDVVSIFLYKFWV